VASESAATSRRIDFMRSSEATGGRWCRVARIVSRSERAQAVRVAPLQQTHARAIGSPEPLDPLNEGGSAIRRKGRTRPLVRGVLGHGSPLAACKHLAAVANHRGTLPSSSVISTTARRGFGRPVSSASWKHHGLGRDDADLRAVEAAFGRSPASARADEPAAPRGQPLLRKAVQATGRGRRGWPNSHSSPACQRPRSAAARYVVSRKRSSAASGLRALRTTS